MKLKNKKTKFISNVWQSEHFEPGAIYFEITISIKEEELSLLLHISVVHTFLGLARL